MWQEERLIHKSHYWKDRTTPSLTWSESRNIAQLNSGTVVHTMTSHALGGLVAASACCCMPVAGRCHGCHPWQQKSNSVNWCRTILLNIMWSDLKWQTLSFFEEHCPKNFIRSDMKWQSLRLLLKSVVRPPTRRRTRTRTTRWVAIWDQFLMQKSKPLLVLQVK